MEDLDVSIKTGNVIAYCPAFLKIKRDTKFVLMLSQIWYWSSRTKDKDGWFYKTQEDWEKELGLSGFEQKRIREIMKTMGLLEEKLKGLPRRLHFRLIKSKLLELLKEDVSEADESISNQQPAPEASQHASFSDTENVRSCETSEQVSEEPAIKDSSIFETSIEETHKQATEKLGSKSEENSQASIQETSNPIYTENTTETTSENNSKITPENQTFVARARPWGEKANLVRQIFSFWQEIMNHPKAQLDDKRKRLISNALDWGYSYEQICEAITGCSQTAHNMGDNDRGERYDGLHVILRNADQIDRFIRNCHNPPKQLSKSMQKSKQTYHALESWMKGDEEVSHGIC